MLILHSNRYKFIYYLVQTNSHEIDLTFFNTL